MARLWLSTTTQARVEQARVDRMADDMTTGRWDPVWHRDEPVQLFAGTLQRGDGNHRLRAAVQAGVAVPMWVRRVDGG